MNGATPIASATSGRSLMRRRMERPASVAAGSHMSEKATMANMPPRMVEGGT